MKPYKINIILSALCIIVFYSYLSLHSKSIYPNLFVSTYDKTSKITFSNLPPVAKIKILNPSGEVVETVPYDNKDSSCKAKWDASKLADGTYYYSIESIYLKKTGKFVVNEKKEPTNFWNSLEMFKEKEVKIDEEEDKEILYAKTFPNPFYTTEHKNGIITFQNLPPHTKIRVYNSLKKAVKTMIFHKESFGYQAEWNVVNVPVGKYYYVLESLYGKKTGKIDIKKYAPKQKTQNVVQKKKPEVIQEIKKEKEIKQVKKVEQTQITEKIAEPENKKEIEFIKEIEKIADNRDITNPTNKILFTEVHPNPCFKKRNEPAQITFSSLPAEAVIKIYNTTGGLLKVIHHNTTKQGLSKKCDLSNFDSGFYIYKIYSPYGEIEGDLVIKD